MITIMQQAAPVVSYKTAADINHQSHMPILLTCTPDTPVHVLRIMYIVVIACKMPLGEQWLLSCVQLTSSV